MTLDKVPVGAKVKVININNSPIKHRLLGIGIVPNSLIEVVRGSPLGDPRVYRVFNKLISLRNSEASSIEVEFLNDYIPLSLASDGEYIISAFSGGQQFLKKISLLGLNVNSNISIKNGEIYFKGKKINLGHGMKEKIFLRRLWNGYNCRTSWKS